MKSVCIVGAAALMAVGVSGCVPVIGAVTLSDLLTGGSLAATALTGKSFSDDALSVATGQDCSVMDATLEKDRHVCEADGAKATQADFKGLIGMARAKPATTPIAADAPDATTLATADATGATNPAEPLIAADSPSHETPAQPRTTAELNASALASRVVN
ncbi:MAG: hypothetical protein ACRED7_07560 [Stellaceae bacterium]